jgi:antitoxin Phd
MLAWQLQDAKARFSEFVQRCEDEGPQVVTKRGAEVAVLISIAEWKRLKANAKPSLKSLLLSPLAKIDLLAPERGQAKHRATLEF